MTGYTVHTGTTIKFSESWGRSFEGGKSAARAESATARKQHAVPQGSIPSEPEKVSTKHGSFFKIWHRVLGLFGAFPGVHQLQVDNDRIKELSRLIDEHKTRLMHYPSGITTKSRLTAVTDPTDDFALKGDLKLTMAIKWPKLYISSEGISKSDDTPDNRVSVYDFVEDKSVAVREMEAHIIPGRHMFSSGFAMLFKYLHFAEGYQKFRWNAVNRGLPSVPECFEERTYEVIGTENLDGIECLHVRAAGYDDIWIAVDRGALVHRRELRFAQEGLMRQVTQIKAYRQIEPGLWLPQKIQSDEYFTPTDDAQNHNRVRIGLQLEVEHIDLQRVDASLFDLRFPAGSRVTDLIAEGVNVRRAGM